MSLTDFSKLTRSFTETSLLDAVSSAGAPTDNTGGVVLRKPDNRTPPSNFHLIEILGGGSLNLTACYIAGYVAQKNMWYRVKALAAGGTIALTATMGYSEIVEGLALYDRVALVGALSASTISAGCTELQASHLR